VKSEASEFLLRGNIMTPIYRKWYAYRVKFDGLEKLLDACSKEGHTLFQVFQADRPKGYYDVIVYKEPPSKVVAGTP
jgi:hypothetical protein